LPADSFASSNSWYLWQAGLIIATLCVMECHHTPLIGWIVYLLLEQNAFWTVTGVLNYVAMKDLHWLPIAGRVKFRTALIAVKVINGTGPK
jgi:diadenosine tetraphosphatase ApaH/serine/threonine PP2A family protein phosphatase